MIFSPESVWYSRAWWARVIRVLLLPLSVLFRGIVALRNFGYDLGLFHSRAMHIPVLSIGNISVGGTGKTPVAAFFARRLQARGYRPAIVLRGYGGDEPLVHSVLSPGVRVHANADRVLGIQTAISKGATAIVLDDAFQHRRVERDGDVVLVSAERWAQSFVLPAGPLREPRRALRRAELIIVTHRTATWSDVQHVMDEIGNIAPHVPMASVYLRLDGLVPVQIENESPNDGYGSGYINGKYVTSEYAIAKYSNRDYVAPRPQPHPSIASQTLSTLNGARVLAIAGIGDPDAFFRQLTAAGAMVDARSFPDHHQYTRQDVERLMSEGLDHKYIVTTLKDMVKLRSLWAPKGPALWYVSQAVDVSSGDTLIDATVNNIFPFRRP